MTRAVVALGLLLVSGEVAPAASSVTGWASAYADGVMDDVIRVRFANDWWPTPPPRGWYESHGAIAVMDCRRVGQMATTRPAVSIGCSLPIVPGRATRPV